MRRWLEHEDEVIKEHIFGLRLEFSMMTVLPFRMHEFRAGVNGVAAAYYPVVGLVLGGIVYALYALLHGFLPETFLRVALFALFTALYGALHLDGFVDTVDGLFAPASLALEVMKEPTIGAMGAIYGFLFLAIKLAAFVSIEEFWLFALIPMLSRFGGTFAMYAFPYVRPSGMGYAAKMELTAPLFVYSALLVCCVIVVVNVWLFALFAVALLKAAAVSSWLSRRFGGLSGDMYGFVIESVELTLLCAVVIWESVR
ncbi:MAG TPA: adenosylcobinamide-GDP ribazoletransferase [Campylobacterales bacterium]|nr:adenosylcobinamide-GDP ribazoletransferase [Campylobacterales bacterium]